MYLVYPTIVYRKSFAKLKRSGQFEESRLNLIINTLAAGKKLDVNYRDHMLHGGHEGERECHVHGDILLVYRTEKQKLILILINIGTHSELF